MLDPFRSRGGYRPTVSSDRLIPRLLARRDRLGRIEKDAILEAVLAGVTPRRRARWWLALAAPVVAAAIVLVVLWPRHDDFTARGGTRAVATFKATCAGACTRGAKLVFDVYGTTSYRYFAAFAKRADGTVLWYFPAADGASEAIADSTHGVLEQGIVLGDEHPAGRYRVYGVFSTTPLTRSQIRERFDEATRTAGPGTEIAIVDLEVR
jgi:hypothetical protein